MAENIVLQQVIAQLKASGSGLYPRHGEVRNVRVVGHLPRANHYVYDLVMDFEGTNERLTAKVYRPGKGGTDATAMAMMEAGNMAMVFSAFQKKKLIGIPRPVGDFAELGAVVTEKFSGFPFQSIIMKAALLPGYADCGILQTAAGKTGEWLRIFHKSTSDMPLPFEPDHLLKELESLCSRCLREGLDEDAVRAILQGARTSLARARKTQPCSAVLNDFTPLNVLVGEQGIGIVNYAQMVPRGASLHDVSTFLAAVESLEKYPFCNRNVTAQVLDRFLAAYGINAADMPVLRVLKMKALLAMYAQGRGGKQSALRKRAMWANVMKRFIQQAAQRSLVQAA